MPRHLSLETLERRRLLANDLVAFASQLADQGITLYGTAWSDDTTQQRQLFEDGGDDLPFVEASSADRTPNQIALDLAITTYPTWIRESDGAREVGVLSIDEIATFAGIEIPQDTGPSFEPLGNQTVLMESPLHLPIDAYDPNGEPLTVTVDVENPDLLQATVVEGNRSIRIDMQGYGDMVFELFEQRAPVASGRVIELAEDDFYNGILFHRVIDEFVIQGGDPTGTGRGGSALGDFDDDFHPELQHNRRGILSFAKSNDDTNDSQFFVTDAPTRFLDFNHSIFGQLVEGDDVLQAISAHEVTEPDPQDPTAPVDRPTTDIVMQQVDVFSDQENSVVMLKAMGDQPGTTNVTFTVTNSAGQSHSETITVSVEPDTANSQPYLASIPEQRGPAGQPYQLQLSSTDIENDAVEYLFQVNASAGPITTNLTDEGLLTITPTESFNGIVDLFVAVRPGEGAPREPANAIDIQRINIIFDDPLLFPALDLLAESDSGSSDSDNLTNAASWDFVVSPTVAGDSVQLIIDDEVVATETATGDSTQFSVSAPTSSGESVTSVLVLRGELELTSRPLTITRDMDAPSLIRDDLPVNAPTGETLVQTLIAADLPSPPGQQPQLTNSLEFELLSGPENATLSDSVLTWEPLEGQLGAQVFEVRITDAAGNSATEPFTITAYQPLPGDQPIVEIQTVFTDLDGNELSALEVGQPFRLELRSTDRRHPFDRTGIFATFVDAFFDSNLVEPEAENPIAYPDDFTLTPSGSLTREEGSDLIDELGAASNASSASNTATTTIAIVQMQAVAAGTAVIELESADEAGRDILLFGSNVAVPLDRVDYQSNSIEIVASWHRETDPSDVNGDQIVTPRDALTVINLLAFQQGLVLVHEIDRSQFDAEFRYDVIPDGRITPRDALFVINEISRQNRTTTANGERSQPDPLQQQPLQSVAASRSALDAALKNEEDDLFNFELW